MEVPQKHKNRTTIQYIRSIPGYLSKQNKNLKGKSLKTKTHIYPKRYIHSNIHSNIIYNSQDCRSNISVHQQMKNKRCDTYLYIYIKWNIIQP